MRIRIIKEIQSTRGILKPGQIVNVKPFVGYYWIEKGWAIEDKSLDGGKEIK